MSFKRDGDDENLIKNLNHQRVRELLGSHIPQDEARLLSNGRLACMICLRRPVFDTINMLAIHRRGKRHILELSKYIQCKEEAILKDLHRKRLLTDDIGIEENANTKISKPNLSTTLSQSALLGSRHMIVKHDRKQKDRLLRKPILEIQPTLSTKVSLLSSSAQTDTKSASATVRHYLKSMSRKSSLEKVVERSRENYGIHLQKTNQFMDIRTPSPVIEHQTIPPESDIPQTRTKIAVSSNDKSRDYEMKLRMSGWIKDLSGKWVKDPNVEFDSDEEEIPSHPS